MVIQQSRDYKKLKKFTIICQKVNLVWYYFTIRTSSKRLSVSLRKMFYFLMLHSSKLNQKLKRYQLLTLET